MKNSPALLVTMLLLMVSVPALAVTREEVDKQRELVGRVENYLSSLQGRLQAAIKQKPRGRKAVRERENRIKQLREEITRQNRRMSALLAVIENQEKQLAEQQERDRQAQLSLEESRKQEEALVQATPEAMIERETKKTAATSITAGGGYAGGGGGLRLGISQMIFGGVRIGASVGYGVGTNYSFSDTSLSASIMTGGGNSVSVWANHANYSKACEIPLVSDRVPKDGATGFGISFGFPIGGFGCEAGYSTVMGPGIMAEIPLFSRD